MKYSAIVVASAAVALAQTAPGSDSCNQLDPIETHCNDSAGKDVAAHAACMCSDNQKFFALWVECRQQLKEPQPWLDVSSATRADICGGSPSGLYQEVFSKLAGAKGLFENPPMAAASSAPSTSFGSPLPVAGPEEAGAFDKAGVAKEEEEVDDFPAPLGTSFPHVAEDGVAEADDILAPAGASFSGPATLTTSTYSPGSTGSALDTAGTAGTSGGGGVRGNSTYDGPTAAASTGKAASGMAFALVGAVLMLAL